MNLSSSFPNEKDRSGIAMLAPRRIATAEAGVAPKELHCADLFGTSRTEKYLGTPHFV
jgi:hypothetical protein